MCGPVDRAGRAQRVEGGERQPGCLATWYCKPGNRLPHLPVPAVAPLLLLTLLDPARPQELKQLSPSAVDLLKRLLQRDPAQRPSAFAALEHPWLSEEGRARDLPLQGSVVQVGLGGGVARMFGKAVQDALKTADEVGGTRMIR